MSPLEPPNDDQRPTEFEATPDHPSLAEAESTTSGSNGNGSGVDDYGADKIKVL